MSEKLTKRSFLGGLVTIIGLILLIVALVSTSPVVA
jgi:hypothetical protein